MNAKRSNLWRTVGNTTIALLFYSGALVFFFARIDYNWDWRGVWEFRTKLLQGWVATLLVSSGALVLSAAIGALLVLLQRAPFGAVRLIARWYVELIRGTPLLVQILIFFYVIANAVGVDNRFVAGMIILAMFAGAYIGEILRGGVESVAASQLDAARAVGFDAGQTWRFVILPQALRQSLPALAGQFVSLVKDSSLLSVIAIGEFTLNVREVNNFTSGAFEGFLPLAIGYLIITLPISLWSRSLEERFRYET